MRELIWVATALVVCGCASPQYLPRMASMQPVQMDCGSGFLAHVDKTAANVLVVSYPLAEAAYAACAGADRETIEARAAAAAIKHLRSSTREACAPTAVTSAGTGAYRVSYGECKPLRPGES